MARTIDGPVFPNAGNSTGLGGAFAQATSGITIRQFYAGMAMQALLSGCSVSDLPDAESIATRSFTIADGMLAHAARG